MADAKALFRKHSKQFCDLLGITHLDVKESAIIYGACILSESIRYEMEEQPGFDEKVFDKQGGNK